MGLILGIDATVSPVAPRDNYIQRRPPLSIIPLQDVQHNTSPDNFYVERLLMMLKYLLKTCSVSGDFYPSIFLLHVYT